MAMRDFIFWFVSKDTRARMEAESRKWIATCPKCELKTSVWDLGGIRYRAAGTKYSGFVCRQCRSFGLHPVRYEENAA